MYECKKMFAIIKGNKKCIYKEKYYNINQSYCLHCGLCFEICPVNAVKEKGETTK